MVVQRRPGACSPSPHIVLRCGGFDFQTDDGTVLAEGPIVQDLAERVAEKRLVPKA